MSGKTKSTLMVAMGAGALIALSASGGVADWIMLVPVGADGIIPTVDGRGPYRVTDAAKLATDSLHAAGGRIPIDENHATDLAAPNGGPSPARGWAVELQARADGIWGRVEWSAPGAALMGDKAYRFISPALAHDKAGNVLAVLRASLTNTPNLRGMAALHSEETNMDLLAQLRKLLGLADDADEAAVVAKIRSLTDAPAADAALQSALAPIAKAAGLADGSNATAILGAITQLKAGTSLASIAKAAGLKDDADVAAITTAVTSLAAGAGPAVVALQSELKAVTTTLNALVETGAKEKATAFVDGEIAKGRVGVKPLRDHYISMHAVDAARVEKEIGALPIMGASGTLQIAPPTGKDGQPSLNSAQLTTAKMLGIKPEDYAKTLAAEQTDAA